jgi:hypothetical protein
LTQTHSSIRIAKLGPFSLAEGLWKKFKPQKHKEPPVNFDLTFICNHINL